MWLDEVAGSVDFPSSDPIVVVNKAIAYRNIAKWENCVRTSGKKSRPHSKGHKLAGLCVQQRDAGAAGFEVSRVREISLLIGAGFSTDFVLSWIHNKPGVWNEVALLNSQGHIVHADVDSIEIVRGYNEAAARHGTKISLRVQVDTGLRGASVADAELIALEISRLPHVDVQGFTAYRSYYLRNEERNWVPYDVIGREDAAILVELRDRVADKLNNNELRVLCGSTATTIGALSVPGVDEVAGGSYVLNDWGLAQMGICTSTDIAIGVIATVVDRTDGHITINAGHNVFGRWDPYPGIAQFVSAATPDGKIGFIARGEGYSTSIPGYSTSIQRVEKSQNFPVGSRVTVFPGHVSELVNIPGITYIYDPQSRSVSPAQRLTTGYYNPDDAII